MRPGIVGLRAAVALLIVAAAWAAQAGVAGAAGLHWGAAEQPPSVSPVAVQIADMSCSGTDLCVAVGAGGLVLTNATPLDPAAWHAAAADPGHDLQRIACATANSCVAVDASGVLVSANPTGGAAAWTRLAGVVHASAYTHPIACPSAGLCVIGDGDSLVSTTEPTSGASAWTHTQIAGAEIDSLACAGPGWCVATGSGRSGTASYTPTVWTSTDPAGGVWTAGTMNGSSSGLEDLSCSAVNVCYGGGEDEDGSQNLYQLVPPASAGGQWTLATVEQTPAQQGFRRPASPQIIYAAPHDVSCTPSQCVDAQGANAASSGGAWISTDPSSGPGGWHAAPAVGPLSAFTCAPGICAYADGDAIATTATPAAGGWRPSPPLGPDGALTGVSCTPYGRCVASGDGGVIVSGIVLASGHVNWRSVETGLGVSAPANAGTVGPISLESVSCTNTDFCAAGGQEQVLAWSSTPATGPWSLDTSGEQGSFEDDGEDLVSASCATPQLCAMVPRDWANAGADGSNLGPVNLFSFRVDGTDTYRPLGSNWKGFDAQDSGTVACPTVRLCLLANSKGIGQVLARHHPFTRLRLGAHPSIACASASFCAIVTRDGRVLTSTRPTRGAWRPRAIDSRHKLTGVACGSAHLCAAIDAGGRVLVSTNPASRRPVWRAHPLARGLTGVSCSTRACVVVDSAGQLFSGRNS